MSSVLRKDRTVKKVHKKILAGAALAVTAAVVAGSAWAMKRQTGEAGAGQVYVSKVAAVNSAGGGLSQTTVNRYSGVVKNQKTQKITLDQARSVQEIYVKAGDVVSEGDPLFLYDTKGTELKIQQAQLKIEQLSDTVESDEEQIGQLQKDLAAAAAPDKPGISAQIQVLQADSAQCSYDIETTKMEIERYQAQIDGATVTAKLSGTVESVADLSGDYGQAAQAGESGGSGEGGISGTGGASAGGGTTLMSIVGTGDLRIQGTVSELNVHTLSEGQPVIVRSRVDESRKWTGTIDSIESKPEENAGGTSYYMGAGSDQTQSASKYSFFVTLDSAEGLLLGQHVTVEPDFGQEGERSGIWLDAGFLIQPDGGTPAFVWGTREAGGKLTQIPVETGAFDEQLSLYEIVSGLSDTDYIAWPDESCREGAPTSAGEV